MANTNILIKRSLTHDSPVSLGAGEFGYSYTSNTLFLGTSDGNGVINVGGVFYTGQIDAATDAATGGTLVRRDATGNANFNWVTANYFDGAFKGNADTATALETPRDFSVSSADITSNPVSFDGTANVVLDANLNVTGVTSGTYGGVTKIPVISVDDKGRLSYAANVDVATTLAYIGDTGTGSLDLLTDTLNFVGGDGITSTVDGANNAVIYEVDNTVIRTFGAAQTITGDLNVAGNVSITGNVTYVNTETLNVADPLIQLAANNTSDILDIGFAGQYSDGVTTRHAGVIRIHDSNELYAFTNYDKSLAGNTINVADSSLVLANLHASLTGGKIYGLANTIGVLDGGTGNGSFTNGSILVGNGTGALQELSNTTYIQVGDLNTTNTVTSITVDAYGRLTDLTATPISGLRVDQGGTGQSSFTQGAILVGDGTNGLKELANVTYTQTGTLASNNTITSISVDEYGRFAATTVSAISGLKVDQGGTGKSTFTTNGLIFGNGSGDLQVTAAAGAADQTWSNQILTTTNAGVPVWSTTLDGGVF